MRRRVGQDASVSSHSLTAASLRSGERSVTAHVRRPQQRNDSSSTRAADAKGGASARDKHAGRGQKGTWAGCLASFDRTSSVPLPLPPSRIFIRQTHRKKQRKEGSKGGKDMAGRSVVVSMARRDQHNRVRCGAVRCGGVPPHFPHRNRRGAVAVAVVGGCVDLTGQPCVRVWLALRRAPHGRASDGSNGVWWGVWSLPVFSVGSDSSRAGPSVLRARAASNAMQSRRGQGRVRSGWGRHAMGTQHGRVATHTCAR
jgi:hypothetical protein